MGRESRRNRLSALGGRRDRVTEWVGGRVASPFYVTEGTPYRPEMILWLELPQDLIVHFKLGSPKESPLSLAAALTEAMASPLVGPPRQPDAIRVADETLAAEVRPVLPQARIVVAPTPELDKVLRGMREHASQDDSGKDPSYFEDGRVSKPAIEELFHSASTLWESAPWELAGDSQILRVDVPEYGVEGACLSIIGALGKSIGLILFPSWEGYERFLRAIEIPPSRHGPVDVGTSTLSLNFERKRDIPASMRDEVARHHWPVADPRAYPIVQHRDRDGIPRPLSERDVRVMSACAASLAAFFAKFEETFEDDEPDPICESYFDENDVEVRLTYPYEAAGLFQEQPRAASASSAEDPTGRRPADLPAPGDAEAAPAPAHDIDRAVVARMDRYAQKRFGPDWIFAAATAFNDPETPPELCGPWAFYHHPFERKPVVEWFLEDRAARLSEREAAWLAAQRAAWLSVWEVLEVQPGRSLKLQDQLTGEKRTVHETSASMALAARDSVLARVVDFEGASVLCGIYPRSLPPRDAAVVVEQARGRLRRRRAVPIDRMRPESIGRYLIACWEEALEEVEERALHPPELQNTDGDPLLVTVDHFAFDARDRAEIQRRLSALEHVQHPPEPDDIEPIYTFTDPAGRPFLGVDGATIIGTATVSHNALRLNTNSVERADSLRAVVETALGALVRHRGRVHADPRAALRARGPGGGADGGQRGDRASSSPEPLASAEIDQAILAMKTKLYSVWSDRPLPALQGSTPRAAARTRSGRAALDLLLKEMENMEARAPAGQRFDFRKIRKELGL